MTAWSWIIDGLIFSVFWIFFRPFWGLKEEEDAQLKAMDTSIPISFELREREREREREVCWYDELRYPIYRKLVIWSERHQSFSQPHQRKKKKKKKRKGRKRKEKKKKKKNTNHSFFVFIWKIFSYFCGHQYSTVVVCHPDIRLYEWENYAIQRKTLFSNAQPHV